MRTERFEAVVSSNEDPDQRGRIQVTCPGLMGDDTTVLPVWLEPLHDWGWFYVPDVGEQVEIEILAQEDLEETPGQGTLEDPVPVWRSKRHLTDVELEDDEDGSVPRPIHADFTATNYAKRRGFCTPWGHTFLFDDTDGDPRIVLTHMIEQLPVGEAPEPEKMTRIETEPDGSIKVSFLNRHQIHFTVENGHLRIALDGEPGSEKHTIEFDAATPELKVSLAEGAHQFHLAPDVLESKVSNGTNAVKIEKDDADTVTTLGDGAVSAVQAEHLKDWLDNTYTPAIADMHDNHFHPLPDYIAPLIPLSTVPAIPGTTPGGAAMAPVVPASLEQYDDGITSTHLIFPEG